MLYYITKPLMFIFYNVFYKIRFRNLHYIKYRKPIILSPNHTNAVIDPITLAVHMRNKLRFFARGDAFTNWFVSAILESLNISPIYRMQEGGLNAVRQNDKVFEECIRLMGGNKTMVLFPEANCVQEMRLRKLKKGLAKMAFETEEHFGFKKEIAVIPVGFHYSNAPVFRSKMFVEFGPPIYPKEFETKYAGNKVRALIEFTTRLEKSMEALMVIVKHPVNDALFHALTAIYADRWAEAERIDHELDVRKQLAAFLNHYEDKEPEKTAALREKALRYQHELHRLNLRDHLLRKENIEKMNLWTFTLDFLKIYFGLPLYAAGVAVNYLPYYIAKKITQKKVRKKEFSASMHANLAWIFWFIQYGIQLLAVALLFRSWLFLGIYAVFVPLSLFYVLRFYPVMKKVFGRWRLLRHTRRNKEAIAALIKERGELIAELDLLRKQFTGSSN